MAYCHVFDMALGQYHWGMEEKKQLQDSDSRHADKYIVRFPDGMRERLKREAHANNRTLNAEIIARLQASFTEPAHGVDRDAAIASSTAEAMLKALDRANEHGKLLLKKVEAIEARLIQPEGASLLKTGTPTVQQSGGVEGLTRRK